MRACETRGRSAQCGGFRANVGPDYEIFDQWTEVLPTDQIVPVEVKYDPKTGRQL